MEDLNALMRRYTAGELGKKDFEGRVFQFIIDNPHCFRLAEWDQETYIDYLCWFYPRLSKAIETYVNTGSSFGAYVNAMVQWSSKEFRYGEMEHGIIEYTYWEAWYREAYEAEPDYSEVKRLSIVSNAKRKKIASTLQILILLLKSYAFASDELIEQIAYSINIEIAQLRAWISEIKTIRLKHDEKIYLLKEHIYSQFCRCLSFERRLNVLYPACAKYKKMKGCLERGRIRLAAMKKRLAGCSLNASNRLVAEVLGIPKGTVDSSLHAVKQKWKKFEEKKSK
jgi:hypothetical protein